MKIEREVRSTRLSRMEDFFYGKRFWIKVPLVVFSLC